MSKPRWAVEASDDRRGTDDHVELKPAPYVREGVLGRRCRECPIQDPSENLVFEAATLCEVIR